MNDKRPIRLLLPTPGRRLALEADDQPVSAVDFFGGFSSAEQDQDFLGRIYALYRADGDAREHAPPAESGVQLVGDMAVEEAVG